MGSYSIICRLSSVAKVEDSDDAIDFAPVLKKQKISEQAIFEKIQARTGVVAVKAVVRKAAATDKGSRRKSRRKSDSVVEMDGNYLQHSQHKKLLQAFQNLSVPILLNAMFFLFGTFRRFKRWR